MAACTCYKKVAINFQLFCKGWIYVGMEEEALFSVVLLCLDCSPGLVKFLRYRAA
jgi:hypothetical protein